MNKLANIALFSQGIQVDKTQQFLDYFDESIRFLRIVDFVNDGEPIRYIKKPEDKYIKKDGEMIMIRYGSSSAGRVFFEL